MFHSVLVFPSKMNNICSWSAKFSTHWRYFNPVKIFRFTSTGTNFGDIIESDSEEKFNEKREKCANEVRLLGRVGMDVVVTTKEGKTYARFSLATSTYWKNNGDEQEKTDWHTIMVFDPNLVMAAAKYIKKGQRLYLSGKLGYTQDNSSRKSAFISLQNFISISS